MLSDFHSIALQVGVQGAPAVTLAVRAVVDDHKVAPAVMLGGLDDNAIGRGQHIGAGGGTQIVTAVAVVLKAGNVLVIRYRIDKQRAVVGVLQQRQLGGVDHSGRCLRRCGGRRGLRLSGFGGLRRGGGGVFQSRAHHAGRHAGSDDHGADHHGPGPQAAVMQQMHDAGLSAALTKGQAAGHAAPLHGKPQNALAVGAAGGGRLASHGSFVAGGLHVALKLAEGQPRQRVEPVQAGHGVKQRLGQRVAPADVGALVQDDGVPGGASQPGGQVDAGPQQAQGKGRGHTGAAEAAIRRFAGQRHLAGQAQVAPHGTHGQQCRAHSPYRRQQMPHGQCGVPGRRRGGGGGNHGRQVRDGKLRLGQGLHSVGGLGQLGILRAGQGKRDAKGQHEPQSHGQPQPAQKPAGRMGTAQQAADDPGRQRRRAAPQAEQQK